MTQHLLSPESIFAQAIEMPSAEDRAAFLDQVCQNDAGLRQELEKLVGDHFRAGQFLERPAAHLIATVDHPVRERPGTMIGPYKLLEEIGEGGMGLVFVAEQQQPIKRRVALKIIKPGMDSRQVVARFEAERQALALMDHPHIAKVHDGGATPEGRPYFVMELVKGTPITEYCDKHRLGTRERLQLFLDVCHAVQHAHQKGIIHRDLKPSNILVEIHDVHPVVKVIDFGIAKATGQQLTDKTVYTAVSQMVGTPLYMSPEQAGLSSLDVDTRSDVYSLGALLYELLTGTTPFDGETLKQAGYDEMRRIIREEEPPQPSGRLSTLEHAALSTIAEKRGSEPRRLSQQLRGELDWIVMKALEKDRNRRYESASAFAADVQRYLDDAPVAACPPSAAYRLRKFARRNKTVLATFAAITLALLLGTGVSIWQAVEANGARGLADERLKSEEHARTQAQTSFQKALEAVERMLHQLGAETMAAFPQLKEARQRLLEDALTLYTDLITLNPRNSMAYFKRGGLYHHVLGKAKEARSDYEKAIELDPENAQAHAMLADLLLGETQALLGVTTPELGVWHAKRAVELQPTDAGLCANLGWGYVAAERKKDGVAALTKAAELCRPGSAEGYFYLAEADRFAGNLRSELVNLERCLAQDPADSWLKRNFALLYINIGRNRLKAGDPEKALTALTKSIELPGSPSPLRGMAYHGRAQIYLSQKRYEAALSDYNMVLALDPYFGGASTVYMGKGWIFFHTGRLQQALSEFTKAVELESNNIIGFFDFGELAASCPDEGSRKGLLALADKMIQVLESKPDTSEDTKTKAYCARAIIYLTAGKLDQADRYVRELLQHLGKEDASKSDEAAGALALLGKNLLKQQQYVLAESVLRECLAIREQVLGPDHPHTLISMADLALGYQDAGKLDLALPLMEETLKLQRAKLGPDHSDTLNSMNHLAAACLDAGKLDLALPLNEETLKLTEAKLGPDHPNTLISMNNLALNYRDAGKLDQADRLGRELLARRRKKDDPKSADTADALAILSSNLVKQQKYAEAEPLLRECMAIRKETLPAEHWLHFGNRLALGEMLLGQQKYAEAEPLLQQGYEGMKQREAKVAPRNKRWLTETVERIVQLYEATNQPEKAGVWRERAKPKPPDAASVGVKGPRVSR